MTHFVENEQAGLALGAQIARTLCAGDVIALRGDLGAGKTTLARGIIQALLGEVEVPSPTYTLIQSYEMPEFELWHCDLYRLEHPEDILELGLLEAMETCAVLLEWPERMGHYLPITCKSIDIKFKGTGREICLSGWASEVIESLHV